MLDDLAQAELANPHPALGEDLYEAIACKALHGDADRRLAHTEPVNQLALGNE